MKRKRATMAASLACGAVCAVCVLLYLHSVQGEAEAARAEALERYGGEQLEVCVATRDIAAGEPIEASDVEMRLWVADLLPAGAVRSVEEVEGRAPSSAIMEGEVVVSKRFEAAGGSLDVPSGMAALSVPAEDVQAVGGSLAKGVTADLYAVGGTSTALLAKDVLVLDTSTAGSEGTSAELSWVTVAVAPESVQEVIDASQRSELYFVLSAGAAPSVSEESEGGSPASADAPPGEGAEGSGEPAGGLPGGGKLSDSEGSDGDASDGSAADGESAEGDGAAAEDGGNGESEGGGR
ncbi:MAG TPA: Flp pilus assembly protein CpaB [Candidatus Aphodovivens avistercoris]|nr:Flp pilus assembly protein CpaB [Candidatus Aphodovivens avistercoris]